MTVQEQLAPALPSLRGSSWALLRYTADGVTASLSSDMRTTLTVDPDGEVRLCCGLLEATGSLSVAGAMVDLGQLSVSGTAPLYALEDRIVHACRGSFEAEMHGAVLRLRRPGVTLEFLPTAG
jgi:hypothetical protein